MYWLSGYNLGGFFIAIRGIWNNPMGKKMKLAIVGSRTFNNFSALCTVIGTHFYYMTNCPPVNIGEDVIISGGAKGADSLAKRYAMITKIDYIEFPAKWDKYGKSAGFKRNQQIVDACDMVLAFWDGVSKGTKHTIELARRAKKPTFIIYF